MERDIEQNLKRQVETVSLESFGSQKKILYLKFVSPGFVGVPDRIILLPGGKVLFVELKSPGKKEHVRQRYVQRLLRSLGFEVFSTVDGVEGVAAVVERCREILADAGKEVDR